MTTYSNPRHVTPHKIVSECVRERETFRYWLPFQLSHVVQDFLRPTQGTDRLSSISTILTALTQLGIYHVGAERAFVSLFDSEYQYFIAEATSGTYLRPSVPNHEYNEPFRLCGTAARRGNDACDYTILNKSANDPKYQDDGELPVTVVPNLVDDDRFPARAIPMLGPSYATFYAAIPIRTKRGINIGVYHVVNTTTREWTDVNGDRLRDISRAISDHLETESLKAINRRNARMSRGIGSFIEGGSTLTGWRQGSNHTAFEDILAADEGNLNPKQQTLESDMESVTSDGPPLEDDELSKQARHTRAPITPVERTKNTMSENRSLANVFSKAANIIRESVEVEGCLFLDATMASYRAHKANTAGGKPGSVGQSSSTSSDDSAHLREDGKKDHICDIKGYSTSRTSSIDHGQDPASSVALSEKFMKKMLNQYPQGKVFVFNVDGELQTSDSSSDDPSSGMPWAERGRPVAGQETPSTSPDSKLQRKPLSRQREGRIISAAFPGARSVAFFPVWDPTKERWCASGLIYTNTPTRTFSVEGELSYLRGFGTLAAVEIARLEALQSAKIKSDALGSLSHELRSPLHGVLLSTELIADTKLDVFQTNIAHTIETCTRTLLDTIDHLLDYSRVNNLADSNKKVTGGQPTSHFNTPRSQHLGKKILVSDYLVDDLVEDVVESVFAGFNFQHKSINQYVSRRQQLPHAGSTSRHADNTANTASDYLEAMDQLSPGVTQPTGTTFSFGNITVILSLDSGCDWLFRFHVGAVRRIVMNIVGNALKYTPDGTITISLTQQVSAVRRRRPEQVVCFAVKDTGKGIGQDYLQRGLFKPFSQENDLSPGTGIGLSLVKQIVKQFRGQISIQSQVGVGTTVTVLLPLERPRSPGVPSNFLGAQARFNEQVQDLAGLCVRIVSSSNHKSALRGTLDHICREWLKLELLAEDDNSRNPDLILWTQDALPAITQYTDSLALIPNVVICQDALAAYERMMDSYAAGWKGVFEFVSQPVGPRKLAKTLSLAYSRWSADEEPHATPPLPGSSPPAVTRRPTPGRNSSYSFSPQPNPDNASRAIPILEPPAAVASEGAGGAVVRALTEREPIDPDHAPRILLVEDNHINLKILAAYMKKLQIRYDKAVNGKEAVEKYTQPPGDFICILSDISMPVMNGFEAARLIRAFEREEGIKKGVPIFAISGLATEEAQREARGSGFNLFLAKPVKLHVLGEILKEEGILKSINI
ncbi:Peroxide stress-activated histidine kinase mak2 [Fusarium oxysporum f. sp. cubense]|uniref:histidine kinase n=1 Tax=Fusarium oxysporum f. sp. cubense TaxID=61366 RepID=A0A559LW94_FUSOC|nr:Peroxide stress-activated histidine kinase mak2 [Fusarium oxysporum f. sp. cubense]